MTDAETGEPLVVYHGSTGREPAAVEEFTPSKGLSCGVGPPAFTQSLHLRDAPSLLAGAFRAAEVIESA